MINISTNSWKYGKPFVSLHYNQFQTTKTYRCIGQSVQIKMAVRTITNTVPSLTKEQANKHLEVYRLAVGELKAFNSTYLRLNNRKYGGWNKTTKASLQENLSYYRGKLHAYETILHMVDENVKAPMVSMGDFHYDKDINHWSLSEGTNELIEHRESTYSEKILQNIK